MSPADPPGAPNWRDFETGGPIRVEGGIRARSQRGSIGSQWWSRRFIQILETITNSGRLGRGRSYARQGQILALDITPGLVTAKVQGSRPQPYVVEINIRPYGEAEWQAVERALAEQAIYRAKLLAGEMPPEIEQLMDDLDLPLFPRSPRDLPMTCSCPDWAVPCKHLSAALYLLAERFDDDPFLVLAWRGRTRETLLASLRVSAEPASDAGPEVVDVPFADRVSDFFSPATSLARLRNRPPALAAPPDLLLRSLPVPDLPVDGTPLGEVLAPAYDLLSRTPTTPAAATDT